MTWVIRTPSSWLSGGWLHDNGDDFIISYCCCCHLLLENWPGQCYRILVQDQDAMLCIWKIFNTHLWCKYFVSIPDKEDMIFSRESNSRISNVRLSVHLKNPLASQKCSYRPSSLSTIEPINHQAYHQSVDTKSLSIFGLYKDQWRTQIFKNRYQLGTKSDS